MWWCDYCFNPQQYLFIVLLLVLFANLSLHLLCLVISELCFLICLTWCQHLRSDSHSWKLSFICLVRVRSRGNLGILMFDLLLVFLFKVILLLLLSFDFAKPCYLFSQTISFIYYLCSYANLCSTDHHLLFTLKVLIFNHCPHVLFNFFYACRSEKI